MKKVLLGVLALTLLAGCSFNLNEEPKDDNNKEENKLEEISVDSDVVKNIVDTFKITGSLINSADTEYIQSYKYKIALNNSSQFIKKESNCNSNMFASNGIMYDCEYIIYSDLNNVYKKLFDSSLSKQDLDYYCIQVLKYDEEENIYRLGTYATGCMDSGKIGKIVKAERNDDNFYIYERTAFVGNWNAEKSLLELPHVSGGIIVDNSEIDKIKENYLDNLDLYKWTFKKNDDGTYAYKSIEYVKDNF